MAPTDDDQTSQAGTLLEQLRAQLGTGLRYDDKLFRVVEVVRGPDGRLARHGQIWHADLSHVRRFGRALAANSVSQQVVVADAAGAVVEQIPVAAGREPAGWDGWREVPLPPAPKPTKARVPSPPTHAVRAPTVATGTLPVVEAAVAPVLQVSRSGDAVAPPPADTSAGPAAATDDIAVLLP